MFRLDEGQVGIVIFAVAELFQCQIDILVDGRQIGCRFGYHQINIREFQLILSLFLAAMLDMFIGLFRWAAFSGVSL